MWKASILSIESDIEGVAKVTYQYDNDDGRTKTFIERISDPNTIKQISQFQLNELNRIDAIVKIISDNITGVIDFSTVLTDEKLIQQEYNKKRSELIKLKQDLDLGLAKQSEYDTKLSEVQKLKV